MAVISVKKVKRPEIIPTIETYESQVPEVSDKKVGESVRAILSYQVVEKTKSFTILRIKHIHLVSHKRSF